MPRRREKLYTINEVAKIVGTKPRNIRLWVFEGYIEPQVRAPVAYFTSTNISEIKVMRAMMEMGLTKETFLKYKKRFVYDIHSLMRKVRQLRKMLHKIREGLY